MPSDQNNSDKYQKSNFKDDASVKNKNEKLASLLQRQKAYGILNAEIARKPDADTTEAQIKIRDQLGKEIDEMGREFIHHQDGIGAVQGLPIRDYMAEGIVPHWRDLPSLETINPCLFRSMSANASLTSQTNHWWQSWGKHFGYICEEMFFPTNVDEISIAIYRAEETGTPIKAIGGGWGFSEAVLPGGVYSDRPPAKGVESFAQMIPATAVYPPEDDWGPIRAGVGMPTSEPADLPGGISLFNPFELVPGPDPDWIYLGAGKWDAINDAISQAIAGFGGDTEVALDDFIDWLGEIVDVNDLGKVVDSAKAFSYAITRGYFPMNPTGDGPGTLVIGTESGSYNSQVYYLGSGKWIVNPLQESATLASTEEVVKLGTIVIPCTPEFALSLLTQPKRAYLVNTQHMVSSLQQDFPSIAVNEVLEDSDRHFFHVEAGITMADLAKLLSHQSPRLAIEASGGSPGATLAGALATATHGGELRKPLLVDRVKAVHLVGPGGVQWWIEGDDPIADPDKLMVKYPCLTREHIILGTDTVSSLSGQDWLNAVVVSMGTIGFNYSMVLEVVPLFGIHEVVVEQTWSGLLAEGSFDSGSGLNPITVNNLRHPPASPAMCEQLGEAILSVADGMLTGISSDLNQYIDIAIDPNPASGTTPETRTWNSWVVNREFLPAVPFDPKPMSSGGIGAIIGNIFDRLSDSEISDRLITLFLLDADLFNEIIKMVHEPTTYIFPWESIDLVSKLTSFIEQTKESADGTFSKVSRITAATDTIDAFLDVLSEPFQEIQDFAPASAIVSGVFSGLFGVTDGRNESSNVASNIGAIGFPGAGIVGSALEVGMSAADAFPFIQNEILDRLNEPFFGYISVRVCPQTQQHLGMQQYSPSVMVELVGFATLSAKNFVNSVQERVVEMITHDELEATLHWGLECDQMNAEALAHISAFNTGTPSKLEKFKLVRRTIHSVIDDSSLFNNAFSDRNGLSIPKWRKLPGYARDISIGADGSVFIIGTDGRIYRWDGSNWVNPVGSSGERIAVDPQGHWWIVNNLNQIWSESHGEMRGLARDIGIGADGSVYIIGTNRADDGDVYQLYGSNWTPIEGDGVSIAVDPNGKPWVVRKNGEIWTLAY